MRDAMSGVARKLKIGFCELPVDKIDSDGGRAIKQKHVKALSESIAVDGLLCPISVTTDGKIVCGRHRLHACRSLGWKKIPAVVVDFDAIHAELAEIDENVVRKDLSAIERSKALARRKELYEALHPETVKGTAGGKASGKARGNGGTTDNMSVVPSFAADTAAATGQSERQVRRDVAIGIGIPDEVADIIADTKLADNKKQLTELAKLEEDDQRAVAKLIVEGKAKTVKAALKAINPVDETDQSPVESASRKAKGADEHEATDYYEDQSPVEAAAVEAQDTATDAEEAPGGGSFDRVAFWREHLLAGWSQYRKRCDAEPDFWPLKSAVEWLELELTKE